MPRGDAEEERLEKICNTLVDRLNRTVKGSEESATLALAVAQAYKALREYREKK